MKVVELRLPENFPRTIKRYGPGASQVATVQIVRDEMLHRPLYILDSGRFTFALLQSAQENICHWLRHGIATLFVTGASPDDIQEILIRKESMEHWCVKETIPWFKNATFRNDVEDQLTDLDRFLNRWTIWLDNWQGYGGMTHPAMIQGIREKLLPWLQTHFPDELVQGQGDAILIQRKSRFGPGPDADRNFLNRDALIEHLAQAGIKVKMIFLEDLPMIRQIAAFIQAKVIIATHGAGLVHLMFTSQATKVIEVRSDWVTCEPFATIALCAGLNYCQVQGRYGFRDGVPTGPDGPGGLDNRIWSHYVEVQPRAVVRALESLP